MQFSGKEVGLIDGVGLTDGVGGDETTESDAGCSIFCRIPQKPNPTTDSSAMVIRNDRVGEAVDVLNFVASVIESNPTGAGATGDVV